MPADASIYSMIRPQAQMPGPLDTYAQGLSVRHMLDQGELSQLQRKKLTTDMAEEEAFKSALSGADLKDPSTIGKLMGVSPTRAIQLQKTLLEGDVQRATLDKTRLETLDKSLKLHRDQLAGVDTPAAAAQWIMSGFNDAALSPVMQRLGSPQELIARIPQDQAQFQQWKLKNGLGIEKVMELTKPNQQVVSLGGKSQMVETNPNASGFNPNVDLKHTMTPDAIASNAIARAHLGVTAATADPFGTLGIRDIAARAGAPTGAPMGGQPGAAAAGGAPAATPAGAAAMSAALSGQDFLATIPKQMGDQVKALAEGRMAFPGGFALKSPYWQQMIQMVSQYDPSFDAVNYNARASTRKDMTSGTGARNLTAINTAIGHLDSLDKAATALGNNDYPRLNQIWNAIAPEVGGTETAGKLRTFQQAKEAVANELMRVFRGTGASSADTQKWAETINQSDSPAALKSSIKSAVDLLDSRIEALNEQYKRGMGTTSDVMEMVNPKSKTTLERLRGGGQETAGKVTAPAAPTRVSSLSQADPAKYAGQVATGDDGVKYRSDGKRWVRQ